MVTGLRELMSRYGSLVIVIGSIIGIISGGVAYFISNSLLISLAAAFVILAACAYLITRPSGTNPQD